MSAISDLRTATRAALVTLKGDASDMSASQIAAIDNQVALIDAEATAPNADTMDVRESCAHAILYGLRTALADVPVVTSALTKSGTKNSAISTYTIAASHTPTSFGASGLPPGVSVNTSTGAITGTPTAAGVYHARIWATNGVARSVKALIIFTIADA